MPTDKARTSEASGTKTSPTPLKIKKEAFVKAIADPDVWRALCSGRPPEEVYGMAMAVAHSREGANAMFRPNTQEDARATSHAPSHPTENQVNSPSAVRLDPDLGLAAAGQLSSLHGSRRRVALSVAFSGFSLRLEALLGAEGSIGLRLLEPIDFEGAFCDETPLTNAAFHWAPPLDTDAELEAWVSEHVVAIDTTGEPDT